MGLIGQTCTPGNRLSGLVLIGRGLTTPKQHATRTSGPTHTPPPQGSARDRPASTIRFTNPPQPPTPPHTPRVRVGTRGGAPWRPTQVHTVAAAMAAGKRPDPSRTRKLSPPAPMVLPGRPGGRAGHRRTTSKELVPSNAGDELLFVLVPALSCLLSLGRYRLR
jgi:hypothetical protein